MNILRDLFIVGDLVYNRADATPHFWEAGFRYPRLVATHEKLFRGVGSFFKFLVGFLTT